MGEIPVGSWGEEEKGDELFDPVDIGSLGLYAVVAGAANLSDLIEQFGWV